MLKSQLDQDLKSAMLSGDKTLVTTLRGLKSAILYAEVEKKLRDTGLSDDEIVSLFAKEAKKRQESAELFKQGGNNEKAEAELAEKAIIEKYLPAQLSDEELTKIVDEYIANLQATSAQMGQVIGAVKNKVGANADGARVAALVKERLL